MQTLLKTSTYAIRLTQKYCRPRHEKRVVEKPDYFKRRIKTELTQKFLRNARLKNGENKSRCFCVTKDGGAQPLKSTKYDGVLSDRKMKNTEKFFLLHLKYLKKERRYVTMKFVKCRYCKYCDKIKEIRSAILNKRSKIILAVVMAAVLGLVAWLGYRTAVAKSATYVEFSVFNSYVMNAQPDDSTDGTTDGATSGTTDGTTDKKVVFVKVVIDNYNYYGYEEGQKSYTYYSVGPNSYSDTSVGSVVGEWTKLSLTDGVNLKIEYKDPSSGSIWSSVISMLGLVLVCVVFWVIISQTAGGGSKALSFGKTKAKVSTNIKVRFSDVAGAEEEKEELQEITEFLKNPHKFSDLGARIPKGVLLVGPPGTGKTLFAKAVAGEAGVPFFSVSGSDFVEMYVGVGASRVRDLFDIAKRNQPCIIFIDEIDAVGRERGAGLGGGSDEREQTLNQILVQMDGFESNEAIIVMAATNRSDVLDPALMRPGRFDRKIMVNLPDVKGREAILKVHSRNKPLESDVNFKTVARITSGFSGADLENLLNEAAILAARAGKKTIGNAELYEGVNKVLMGPQKKSRVVTESDKRCTAYHESGHAIIDQLCAHTGTVHEVTIIPRGDAGGYTFTRPDSDDQFVSKNELNDDICGLLGGRVAEELVLKDVTQGAISDLQRASNIARKMVTELGMSDKLGLVSYGEGKPVFIGRQLGSSQQYSEQTAALIDNEVRTIIEEQHERATEILTKNRSVLDNMARVLVERNTIYTEEVAMLVNGASVEEVLKAMDERDKKAETNPFKRFEEASSKNAGFAKSADGENKQEEPKASGNDTDPFGADAKNYSTWGDYTWGDYKGINDVPAEKDENSAEGKKGDSDEQDKQDK